MSRLPFEAFLALRYLRPRRTFVSVITLISIVGVMLGVAVLIVVIAVMSGFDQEWRTRILGFNAHLKVFQQGGFVRDYPKVMKTVSMNSRVKGVAPFVVGPVLVPSMSDEDNSHFAVPALLGIDPVAQATVSVLPKSIQAGTFDVSFNRVLIGSEFAANMGLHVDDRLNVYSPTTVGQLKKARDDKEARAILPEELKVSGIFDVGYNEFNANFIVVSVEKAQEMYQLPEDAVHGLQVMLNDPFQANLARKEMLAVLGPNYFIKTWPEERPELFNALKTEKNMMFFLLFFIMIVAAFGIVNSQITFVVQKTREIGILKALGSNNRQILALFLSQSVVVGVLGVGCGYGLAMLALTYRNEFLRFMNNVTGYELLPAAIYQIYELPAVIEVMDVSIICGTAFITCILAGVFPAWKASRLQPVEALRHE